MSTILSLVKNGRVEVDAPPDWPDGTPVRVELGLNGQTKQCEAGSPLAVLAAMEAEPHLSTEDITELERAITSGKRPAATIDPFAPEAPGAV